MKSFFYTLFFLFFLSNPVFLFAQKEKYTKDIGVYFEVRTDTNNFKRYTEDNEIYKANYTFYYSLEYFDKNGIQKYYTLLVHFKTVGILGILTPNVRWEAGTPKK